MIVAVRNGLRWVLDTNVVLSALIRSCGVTGKLRLAWQAELFTPLINRATATELIRVLGYPKFKLSPAEQHELLADYLPRTEVVPDPARPPSTPACRDPHDVPFLQLAFSARADALVTGNANLLILDPPRRIALLTPAQAVARLSPGFRQ